MASNTVRFLVSDDDVEEMLSRAEFVSSFGGMSKFLDQEVDPYLRARAAHRFASEGDAASGKWAPLAPSTVAIRRSEGYPGEHPINRRTGDLERWITGVDGRVTPGESGGDISYLVLPGGNPYGEIGEKIMAAQTGNAPSGKRQPRRPVLAMDNSDLQVVLLMMGNFFEKEIS